ncbi:hypothetical protein RUM43_002363, partial [Polyplax serrata]
MKFALYGYSVLALCFSSESPTVPIDSMRVERMLAGRQQHLVWPPFKPVIYETREHT